MKTRAAILFESNQPLVIDDVEIPTLKRGQVLVKIFYSGVCRAQYNEIIALKGPDKFLPHLLGHEASAMVIDIGKGVKKVKAGDCVCLSWIKSQGLDGINSQYKLGSRLINAGGVTTFSDYAVVSENRMTKISSRFPKDIASILGCAVLTGCGIVENTAQVTKESSVAVFGVGGIGLSVILAAKQRRCKQIIALDIDEQKLLFAKRLGATHGFNVNQQDALLEILKISPQGIDLAVDASGNKSAMQHAFAVVKDGGGQCVIAGNLAKDQLISIHPFDLIKGKRLMGTWGGESKPDRDVPKYIRMFNQGRLPFDKMITHRFDLEHINQAFDVLQMGQAGRIIIKMKD